MKLEHPLVERIRTSVIGDDAVMMGPYGPRRLTYADHAATGRALSFVEDVIRTEVLPWYANTHSDSSATGRRTTQLREDARRIIRDAVGGDDDTLVIFTGSGSTGAIDKLMRILGLGTPLSTSDVAPIDRAVVFVGPYEHHSNELPWRESAAEVVRIDADAGGRLDLDHLDRELLRYADRRLRIGSFSAGSNVTGVLTDVAAVSEQLHQHGALACWDYAAAGSHSEISIRGASGRPQSYLDAVFLSPHKFPGGPGTPGVLAVRRAWVRNPVPTVPGGGTVSYVHPAAVHYIDDPIHREEGGTPAIVESIRAGLAFRLKQDVGAATMVRRENDLVRTAIASWRENPAIELLGDLDADRLPIVSMVIRPPGRRRLHHNFVVAVLNDLFGIQCRGGCSCAGPYGHRLLRIDDGQARALAERTVQGWLGIKPGWTRVSFAYYMSDAAADYIVQAIHLVARYGDRLLPDYRFDPRSGQWTHRAPTAPAARLDWLGWDCEAGPLARGQTEPDAVLADQLGQARAILEGREEPDGPSGDACLADGLEALRWFQLPAACLAPPEQPVRPRP